LIHPSEKLSHEIPPLPPIFRAATSEFDTPAKASAPLRRILFPLVRGRARDPDFASLLLDIFLVPWIELRYPKANDVPFGGSARVSCNVENAASHADPPIFSIEGVRITREEGSWIQWGWTGLSGSVVLWGWSDL